MRVGRSGTVNTAASDATFTKILDVFPLSARVCLCNIAVALRSPRRNNCDQAMLTPLSQVVAGNRRYGMWVHRLEFHILGNVVRGACVEANYQMYLHRHLHRRCHTVVAAVAEHTDENVTFTFRGAYGGIVGKNYDNHGKGDGYAVHLRTVGLAKLLSAIDAPATVDYLSLDVEGAESAVMQGFPWSERIFMVITVERPKADLVDLLSNNAYVHLRNLYSWEQVWLHRSFPQFDDVLRLYGGGVAAASLPKTCLGSHDLTIPHHTFVYSDGKCQTPRV